MLVYRPQQKFSHVYRSHGTICRHGQQILDALAKDRNGMAVSNIRYADLR